MRLNLIIAYFRGYVVVQLVETLCYKPEGHGFRSRWGHWIFHDLFLLAILWLWGTRNISWELWQLLYRADNLANFMIFWKSWELNLMEPLGPAKDCMGYL